MIEAAEFIQAAEAIGAAEVISIATRLDFTKLDSAVLIS